MNTFDTSQERERQLADSLGCIVESDLCLLAGILPATAEDWRKRGRGPAYILVGNKYLYPRDALTQYLSGKTRERQPTPAKGLL